MHLVLQLWIVQMMDILCLSLVQLEIASVNVSMASLEHNAKVRYSFSLWTKEVDLAAVAMVG
jgi:hypothetical protein